MPLDKSTPDLADCLKQLLLVQVPGLAQSPCVIFTTAPQLWSTIDLPDSSILVDLATLLGTEPWYPEAIGFESVLEIDVFKALISAGWPESMIRTRFRPDARSPLRFDVAICDADGNALVAIEVKRLNRRSDSERAALEQSFSLPTVRWACITDSETYTTIGRDGSRHETSSPPSPTDLGLSIDHIVGDSRFTSLLHRPSSVDVIKNLFAEIAPARIVIDFTLPWGQHVDRESLLFTLLPDALVQQVPGRMDTLDLLLIAVSGFSTVQQIAAIMPPGLAFASSKRWERDWLQSRLGVAAHIELPQASCGRTSIGLRASYLLLGGKRSGTYFDSFWSSTDVIHHLTESPNALAMWLRGTTPPRGYVKASVECDNWSYSSNDPEADVIRNRLAALGTARRLGDIAQVFMSPALRLGTATTDTNEDREGPRVLTAQYLRTGDVQDVGWLSAKARADLDEELLLKSGDVLVPRIYRGSVEVVSFNDSTPAIAGNTIIVVRLTDDTISPSYIAEFLSSAAIRRLLEVTSATHRNHRQLSVATLRDIPVPDLSVDMAELQHVRTLRATLIDAASELKAQRAELFDSHNKAEFQSKLTRLRSQAQLLAEAIRLSGSRSFQIGNLYPFPLAFGYRLLPSYVDCRQRYQEQLRVAENMLAFLASVSLALVTNADRATLADDLRAAWSTEIGDELGIMIPRAT